MSSRSRRRGPKPYPLVRLTSDSHRAIDATGTKRAALAAVSGFPNLPSFSGLLYSEFAASPLTLERLAKDNNGGGFPKLRILARSRPNLARIDHGRAALSVMNTQDLALARAGRP